MKIDAIFAAANDAQLCNAMKNVVEERYGFYSLLEREAGIPHERWVIHTVLGTLRKSLNW